jgi:hypothetical protein
LLAPLSPEGSSPRASGSPGTGIALRLDRLLARFPTLDRFMGLFDRALTPVLRAFLRAYVGGRLALGQRTTLRSLAREVGVSATFLGNLLRDPGWDERELKKTLQGHLQKSHRGRQVSGLIFESERLPRGMRVETSQEGGGYGSPTTLIHLGLSDREYRCVIDSEAHFPRERTLDRRRRDAAGIPENAANRSRTAIALDLLDHAKRQDFHFEWLLLNKRFGEDPSFLLALAVRGQQFIAEIPPDFLGWVAPPYFSVAWSPGGSEPPSLPGHPQETPRPARPVRDLMRGIPLPDQVLPRAPGGLPSADHWQAGISTLYPSSKGFPAAAFGLLVLRHATSGETKFFLSNGFMGTPLRKLAGISLSRHSIESGLQEDVRKSGLLNLRAQGYAALRRHLVLSLITLVYGSESARSDQAPLPSGLSAASSAPSVETS